MSTRLWNQFNSIVNFGDEEVAKLTVLINNFTKSFREFAFTHTSNFNIFVVEHDQWQMNSFSIRRLRELDDYPVPARQYRPSEINCFHFRLEAWQEADYFALILGDSIVSPISMCYPEFKLKKYNDDHQWQLCTRDLPSERELREAYSRSLTNSEASIIKQLSSRQKGAFNRYLSEEVLPIWEKAPLCDRWKTLKKSQPLKLDFDWTQAYP